MNFDIDIAIVVGFLILTLVVGLGHGRNVKTIKDYALGGRNFSTAALVATIVATYASGSGFFVTLSKTYSDGFSYMFARFGLGVYFFVVSFVLIPRMGEFLGKVSIAEAMGDLYDKRVRLITAITGAIGGAGAIAIQFKVFGNIFSYFLHLPSYIAIFVAGVVATTYSAFGGIRAVTFTDILQFFAFGVIIPLVGFVIWSQFYNEGFTIAQATSDPKFNLKLLLYGKTPGLIGMIAIFFYIATPTMSASAFQRIAIGNSLNQIKKAFFISSIILILIQIITAWIPFLIYSMNPELSTNHLLGYIIDTYSHVGLRGLIIIAIIAFAMSTADSRINSASVLFTHDIYGLFVHDKRNEIFVTRLFAFLLGIGAIILSLIESDLLGIAILANSFYYPIVTPIFLFSIFGFRSSSKSALIGMFAGFVATVLWKVLPIEFANVSQKIVGLFVAMFCNAAFFIGSHYFLSQSGGWVGIKDKSYLDEQKMKKKQQKNSFNKWINDFNVRGFCKKIAPHNDITYTTLGIYFIVCTITTMYSTQVELLGTNAQLMKIIYPLMLITGTLMAMYQLWPLSITTSIKERIIQACYPMAIFYMLIFFSCFFVIVSKFAMLQVALFIINLMIVALLLGWRIALPLIIIGFYLSIQFYQYFFGATGFEVQFGSPEFVLIYIVLFLGSTVIIFLKPKQEQQEAVEAEVTNLNSQVTDLNEKVTHYSERVSDQSREIERLGATAQKILNNVNHELRLPVGNVQNFAEMLNDGLGKFDAEQLKMLSDEVYKNSNRLSSMIMNMLDLATLESKKIELSKSTINLGELVRDRVQSCRKIYLEDKQIDFEMKIEEDILIKLDPNYMRQTVDNLVINAINFSQEGVVKISVLRKEDLVEFVIQDSGIGIPKEELYDIFTPFKMGTNVVAQFV